MVLQRASSGLSDPQKAVVFIGYRFFVGLTKICYDRNKMTTTLMNYTTRSQVENFAKRVFSEVQTAEFNSYLLAAEAYINNYCGYNNETTTSGMMYESITSERQVGKIDNYGNLVIDVGKPPVAFDVNGNPLVSLVQYEFGGIRVPLQITDGTGNALNTLLDVSENRRKIIYPSIYFLPYLPTVTPTAKMNLYNLRDTKFWTLINYYGGYPVLPYDIVQAANILTLYFLTIRDNPNFVQMIRQGSYTVDYFQRSNRGGDNGRSESKMVIAAQEILDSYVRHAW